MGGNLLTVLLAAPAFPLQLTVGDIIQVSQTGNNHSRGGEFLITGDSEGYTFCAETGEEVVLGAEYIVVSVDIYADTGAGRTSPFLTPNEAYLMTQYWSGAYIGRSYSALQQALWYLQGASSNFYTLNSQVAWFVSEAVNASWNDIGHVRIASLETASGKKAQDVYVQAVPEPGTLLLFGLGLSILFYRKKIFS